MTPLGPCAANSWRVSAEAADLVRVAAVPRPVELAARPKRLRFDLARTAIIIVDMQNDFCHPQGWLAALGVDVAPALAPVAPLNALLPLLRAAGVTVIWLNWGSRPDRLNLSPALRHVYDSTGQGRGIGDPGPSGAATLQQGSWSASLVDGLVADPADIHVAKHRMSGFWDTPLDSILRNLAVSTLLFAGINLDQCVLHTLADGNFLGYDTILLEDCAATTNPDFCRQATLLNIQQIFGFLVASTDLAGAIAP